MRPPKAWLKNLTAISSDVPVHLGLRKAVEQVAENYWRALEEEPGSLLAEIELILWATRNAASARWPRKYIPPMKWSWETYFPPPPRATVTSPA